MRYGASRGSFAVFLHNMLDRAAEMNRLADLSTTILYETGRCIQRIAVFSAHVPGDVPQAKLCFFKVRTATLEGA